jgi:outer membrane protein assembly factor BamB
MIGRIGGGSRWSAKAAAWALAALAAATPSTAVAAEPASGPATGPASAPAANGVIASRESGWPQWRGPRRDGICDEKGLLPAWPAGGPKLLWKIDALGRGYSCPIITGGRLYITGDVGNDLRIFAYDLAGKLQWQAVNGRAWKRSYGGARACCLMDGGRLYHMNAFGRVACLDPADGREVWAVDTLQRLDAPTIAWGHSECLLADGPRLIVTPGGRKGMMAALDKATGRTVWASDPIEGDTASYSSPILFAFGGRRHLVSLSSRHAFGVDADSSKLLWTQPRPTRYLAITTTPLYRDGRVVVASPDGKTAEQYRLVVSPDGVRAEPQWLSPMKNMSGGIVCVDGMLYGSGYPRDGGWRCVDFATGKVLYEMNDLTIGPVLWADGRLYCLSETGDMALLQPTSDGFRARGRFTLVAGEAGDVWAHPVIHEGKLYLRYHDTLWCYDVRAERRGDTETR